MRVYRYLSPFSASSGPQALAIGSFDGVHRGHQAILAHLCEYARERACPAAVMTFDVHPARTLNPDKVPLQLLSLSEKLVRLRDLGIDKVYVLRFTEQFQSLGPEVFIEDVLIRHLRVCYLVSGEDFRFGYGRRGDMALLQQYHDYFDCASVPAVYEHGQRISSTAIRQSLLDNDFDTAEQLLGRPFSYYGHVMYGAQRGRTMGFPTLNLLIPDRYGPFLQGVFVTAVRGLGPTPLAAVSNVGVRPTLHADQRRILETHVFDFNASVYGQRIEVDFFHKLRDEQSFPSVSALCAAIASDTQRARDYYDKRSLILS